MREKFKTINKKGNGRGHDLLHKTESQSTDESTIFKNTNKWTESFKLDLPSSSTKNDTI